jgi:transitional endoplasmic reticulum ATPase
MAASEELIQPLREALLHSPDNVPLRLHVARLLLTHGRFDEAETEYRTVLEREPGSEDGKIGLARVFSQQGKVSAAIVIVEELLRAVDCSPQVMLLHARLLIRTGEMDQAAREYRRAVDIDPNLADADLAEQLGVRNFDDTDDADTDEYQDGRVRVAGQGFEPPAASIEMEKPQIDFDHVGGMESVKKQIQVKLIGALANADLYKAYGKQVGGGVLMYGPPGCGKTHMARATAGQVKAGFFPVGIHDVLDMWMGNSEKRLHALFQNARNNTPCVLFFDEVDALGASRTDMRQSAGRQLINQFLAELDGVRDSNEGVMTLAATNAPWHLDAAFRRPGRFDRVIFVPPPDRDARAAILRIMLRGKPVDDVDFEKIAGKTDAFSGADLKAVVDNAVEAKLELAMQTGTPVPIGTRDLLAAMKTVKPSTKEWFATARNYALYSNEGGVYDEIIEYMNLR